MILKGLLSHPPPSELQRTNSSVCLMKVPELFLEGECAFGFVERRIRGREGKIFSLSTRKNFLAINLTFIKLLIPRLQNAGAGEVYISKTHSLPSKSSKTIRKETKYTPG